MKNTLFGLLMIVATSTQAETVTLYGELPLVVSKNFDVFEESLEEIKKVTKTDKVLPIEIYFVNFRAELMVPYPDLVRATQLEKWNKEKFGEAERTYWAYTYSPSATPGKIIIQVASNVFEHYYTIDPLSGIKNLATGSSFYLVAHELLHAVLYMDKSIYEEMHHCIILREKYSEALINFLMSKNKLTSTQRTLILVGEKKNWDRQKQKIPKEKLTCDL